MKLRIALLITTLFCLNSLTFAEPMNLASVKEVVKKYHDSGTYAHDQQEVIAQAQKYLTRRIKSNAVSKHPKKLAMVLDIDDTALSTYDDMVKMDFGGPLTLIEAKLAEGHDPAIKPTLDLYRFAKKNHVAVFFVTGRRPDKKIPTIRNLNKIGYHHWDELLFKPRNYHKKSVVPYKSHAREQIEKRGFDIALNIGDQMSDLEGGHSDKFFKLPNPYYFIP